MRKYLCELISPHRFKDDNQWRNPALTKSPWNVSDNSSGDWKVTPAKLAVRHWLPAAGTWLRNVHLLDRVQWSWVRWATGAPVSSCLMDKHVAPCHLHETLTTERPSGCVIKGWTKPSITCPCMPRDDRQRGALATIKGPWRALSRLCESERMLLRAAPIVQSFQTWIIVLRVACT